MASGSTLYIDFWGYENLTSASGSTWGFVSDQNKNFARASGVVMKDKLVFLKNSAMASGGGQFFAC